MHVRGKTVTETCLGVGVSWRMVREVAQGAMGLEIRLGWGGVLVQTRASEMRVPGKSGWVN